MKTNIINGKVILEDRIASCVVVIEDGVIVGLEDEVQDGEVIDAQGYYVSPGFLDVHIHGCAGHDVMDATFEALNGISKAIVKQGVTSFFPTTLTQSNESTYLAVKNVKIYKDQLEGAIAEGVHLEGPFFDNEFKGAQPEEYITSPSLTTYFEMVKDAEDIVKMISLAPEKQGAMDLIHYVTKKGVVASIGHTGATYDIAIKSFDAGITHATHTFNGMRGFNHREPGVVGAIMDDSRVYAELILDGIHVHYASARALAKIKGPDKMVLVTDCMRAGQLPEGTFDLGGQVVTVLNKAARLESGALAGSVLNLNEAVRHAHQHLGYSLVDVVKWASTNPARNCHLDHIGSIAVNKQANIILFDDMINVSKVFIKGKQIV